MARFRQSGAYSHFPSLEPSAPRLYRSQLGPLLGPLSLRDPACTRVTLAAKVTMSTHQRIEAGNGARRSICAYLCCDAPLLSDGHSSHTITIFIPTDCHLSRLLVIAASRRLGRHSGHHRYSGEAGQIVEDHTQSRYSDKVAAMQSSATFDIGQAQSPPLLRRGRADDRRGPHTIAPL